MALPTLSKTWLTKVNMRHLTTGNALSDHQADLFCIKQALTDGAIPAASGGPIAVVFGTAAAPRGDGGFCAMQVRGSSNGTTATACPASPATAPAANADLWTSANSLV